MRLSLFWRLGLTYLALVAAILVTVELAAPGTVRQILPALLVILLAVGIALFVFLRSTASRIRRLEEFARRAGTGISLRLSGTTTTTNLRPSPMF